MKKLYQAPKSENVQLDPMTDAMLDSNVGSAVSGATTEAPERQGGDFMPL